MLKKKEKKKLQYYKDLSTTFIEEYLAMLLFEEWCTLPLHNWTELENNVYSLNEEALSFDPVWHMLGGQFLQQNGN